MDIRVYSALAFLARVALGPGAPSMDFGVLLFSEVALEALALGTALFFTGRMGSGADTGEGAGEGDPAGSGTEVTLARGVRLGFGGCGGTGATTGAGPPILGLGLGVSRLATKSGVALGGSGRGSG